MSGSRTGRRAWAIGAAAVVLAAPAAGSASVLAEGYAVLGSRPGDPPPASVPPPVPVAHPAAAPGARYPLRGPTEVVATGPDILVAESMTGRVLRLRGGRVTVVRGRKADGLSGCAETPGVSVDRAGNAVTRRAADGTVTALAGTGRTGFAGDGGPADEARLNGPTCAVVAADGSVLVADEGNLRVRRISPDGVITTIAGDGSAGYRGDGLPATATGMVPREIEALPDGRVLVSDPHNARVLEIRPDGTVSTFAGTGAIGFDGDGGDARAARLTAPWGIARAAGGAVYIADFAAQTVRRVSPAGRITTVLGAPPQRRAAPSLALSARVPSRRTVLAWVEPQGSGSSFGDRSVADEAASGRRAVIRSVGYAGGVVGVTVVQGARTVAWDDGDGSPCWWASRTTTGVTGDPLQARDLQAGARSPAPYAPGPGPYGPDLRLPGGLVLARVRIALDTTPLFGTPAWYTDWKAQRVVEYVIDPATRAVVAVQAWSPWGFQRQYRIRHASGRLAVPSTRPRGRVTTITSTSSTSECGPPERPGATPRIVAFGYPEGISLARRVNARLSALRAVTVRLRGRSNSGRPFAATARLGLRGGRATTGLTHVVSPGRPDVHSSPPGGSYTEVVRPSGEVRTRFDGEACWRGTGMGEPGVMVGESETPEIVPLEGAFLERPHVQGRLIRLRAYVGGLVVDSLVAPRGLRLVAQRFTDGAGDTGVLRIDALGTVPRLPATGPACPDGGP